MSRQIFALADQQFEDHQIPKSVQKDMPFHKLLVLTEDGKPLAQSLISSKNCQFFTNFLSEDQKLNGVAEDQWIICDFVAKC
ncbi:unnamed protein product [Caenorhabditis sp. 36 PRJEB53466]|nr:unnamed protein product [Caenorhabditis sp. 36 PRJEB53466]